MPEVPLPEEYEPSEYALEALKNLRDLAHSESYSALKANDPQMAGLWHKIEGECRDMIFACALKSSEFKLGVG